MTDATDIQSLIAKCNALEIENERLKRLLKKNNIDYSIPPSMPTLSLQKKVELFMSLFKGREDVFARRWYSTTTGKSGYQPVCEREWNKDYCDKRKYKCADCPNRKFAALTYDDIYKHLEGKDEYGRDVVGAYAILENGTCHFLCADFDDKSSEHGYKDDVLAYCSVCKEWGVKAYVERSRSGNGAHVWILFETPIQTIKARLLGNLILTEAMNRNGCMSFKSYDRFFPNQDVVPEGGFGNLVALPLQGRSRKSGNSVFVDENFEPYTNQWQYLLELLKMTEADVDLILSHHQTQNSLGELSKSNESAPWEIPSLKDFDNKQLPTSIEITYADKIYIPYGQLPAKTVHYFKRVAAFRNPDFYRNQAMHLPTYNIPRIISCAEITDNYLAMPRGCEDVILALFRNNNVDIRINDETNHGIQIDVAFYGTLKNEQNLAVQKLYQHNTGTLSATTAFGKTVSAIGLIAKRKVNTLILVHTKTLLDQWTDALQKFLIINYTEEDVMGKHDGRRNFSPIGHLFNAKNTIHGIIDIALLQSCIDVEGVKPFVRNYGLVIVDECHHVSAVNFESILKCVTAKYVYGLTATPIRKDGHQPLIFMQCGPIRYQADAKQQMSGQTFNRILIPRFTSFKHISNDIKSYTQTIQELAADELRNRLIIKDVKDSLDNGRTPIVLTSLTAHARHLESRLAGVSKNVILLVGSESTKNIKTSLERLKTIHQDEPLVIVATGKFIGEGFDFPRLDTLFLTLPVSWKGIVEQYAGRLHREYEGKKEVRIYDYVDIRVPLCDTMYKRRLRGYVTAGYQTIINDAACDSSTSIIYNGSNFNLPFEKDLNNASKSVVLFCGKVKSGKYISALENLLLRGVDVKVIVKNVGYDEGTLISKGIEFVCVEDSTLSCAIIDRRIVWYGSINFCGYNSIDYNAIRIENFELASELLENLK